MSAAEFPESSTALTSAPRATRNLTISLFPSAAAPWSAV